MIEAGEVGGVLDEVLERLALHFEKEHKLNEKVKSAMTYPAVVISMAVLALVFMLTFVLPTFIQMFEGMKIEIPAPTKVLLFISDILRNDWMILILLAGALVIGGKIALQKPKYKKMMDALILRLPVFGVLAQKIAIARFSRTLSTLVKGGVPLIAALEVVKKTIGNLSMIQALSRAQVGIKEGQGLSNTLAASGVFTPMVIQMIAIGEESGELDGMLEKVADFYESEVDDMVGRLSSILEPFIILVLGLCIGFIIISVMLPVFDVITGANKL
jgi:type IV pilus assembly protein PilC